MKRLLKLFAFSLALVISLSSCLTIEDEYTFKKDGSGSMTMSIDMSEMKSLLQMAMQESEEGNPMEEVNFEEFATALRQVEGLSNVTANNDMENYQFAVGFDFKDLAALNRGLAALGREGQEDNLSRPDKNVFMSRFQMAEALPLGDMMGDMGEEGDMEKAQMFFGTMKYNLKLNFQKPVQALYASEKAKVNFEDKKGKTISISASFLDLMSNPQMLNWTAVTK